MPSTVFTIAPLDAAPETGKVKMTVIDMDRAFKFIRGHEGFEPEAYKDTKGKWTIGIGSLIGDGSEEALAASGFKGKKISEDTAAKLANDAIVEKTRRMFKPEFLGKVAHGYSPELQTGLISGFYRGDVSGSPKTLALLNSGDLVGASKEFLNSNEYRAAKIVAGDKKTNRGVAGRMEELANLMATEGDRRAAKAEPTFQESVEARLRAQTNQTPM